MSKNRRSNVVPVTLLTVMTLTLCGGCATITGSDLETFVRETLLSAAAAFLL